jgi:2-methylcitrate dehydratase PrpD
VARAFFDGDVTDAAFEPDAVADESVLALCARIHPLIDPALADRPPVGLPGALTVTLRDGGTVTVDAAPHPPDDEAFLRDRFRRTAGALLDAGAAAELEQAISGAWGAHSIRDVTALAAG